MDGFALRASDVRDAGNTQPLFLPLAGDVRPGSRAALPERSVMRIATGGPLPHGADCVVRVEDVFVDGNAVGISKRVDAGADVIRAGADIGAGTTVARRGTTVNAATLGVLATLGHEHVAALRRPTVALITTGDEVVTIATSPRAGEVRNSNAVALAALLRSFGFEAVNASHVRDDAEALYAALVAALEANDAVVVSGGSSVGARDFTSAAFAKLRPPGVVVHGVRMKPGRPVILAASASQPVIGVPGNPTAAMLGADDVRPADLRESVRGAGCPTVHARYRGRTAGREIRLGLLRPGSHEFRRSRPSRRARVLDVRIIARRGGRLRSRRRVASSRHAGRDGSGESPAMTPFAPRADISHFVLSGKEAR